MDPAPRAGTAPAWRQRVLGGRMLVLVGTLALLSGVPSTLAVGPWAWRISWLSEPAHAGTASAVVTATGWAHLLLSWSLLSLMSAGTWVRRQERGRWGRAAALGLLGAGLLLAHAIPWERLPPWAPRIGPVLSRPVVVSEAEGPFPELVGVALDYAPGWYRLGPTAVSGRGLTVVALAHAIVPLMGLAWLLRRRPTGPKR